MKTERNWIKDAQDELKEKMKKRILMLAVILLVLMPVDSYSAQKQIDPRARNIFALFTKHNPKLNASTAKKYSELVIEASEKYKQDPYVIAAIIVHESTVNNKAVSKGGDYGLMQIRWKYHKDAVRKDFPKVKEAKDMFDARVNIFYGTKLFGEYMKKANNDLRGGLMGYSAGGVKLTTKVLATVKELQSKDKNNNKRKGK